MWSVRCRFCGRGLRPSSIMMKGGRVCDIQWRVSRVNGCDRSRRRVFMSNLLEVSDRMPRAWRRTDIHADLRSPRDITRGRESADGLETVRLGWLARGIILHHRSLMRLFLMRTLLTPLLLLPYLSHQFFAVSCMHTIFGSLPLPTPFD